MYIIVAFEKIVYLFESMYYVMEFYRLECVVGSIKLNVLPPYVGRWGVFTVQSHE